MQNPLDLFQCFSLVSCLLKCMLDITVQNDQLTVVPVSRPTASTQVASLLLKGDLKYSAWLVCSGPDTQRGSPGIGILKRFTRAENSHPTASFWNCFQNGVMVLNSGVHRKQATNFLPVLHQVRPIKCECMFSEAFVLWYVLLSQTRKTIVITNFKFPCS